MKARVKPGPRPGWGRVDIDNFDGKYVIRCSGRPIPAKIARIGRFQQPCLIFPLSWVRVGDEVEVEPVLECKVCRKHVTVLINDLCDDCYIRMCGDMVSPPLVAAIYGGRGR